MPRAEESPASLCGYFSQETPGPCSPEEDVKAQSKDGSLREGISRALHS